MATCGKCVHPLAPCSPCSLLIETPTCNTCQELPTGYLSEGGGKTSKWVDNKKAAFKFNIVLDSTVISSDLYVHSFLMNTEEYLSLKPSDDTGGGNINLAMGGLLLDCYVRVSCRLDSSGGGAL